MSETVLIQKSKRVEYLEILYKHLKTHVDNLVEETILINKAKEASANERAERSKLLKLKNTILESEKPDGEQLKNVLVEIGKLNKKIAEIEKPFREQAKPYREAKKEAFVEIIKTMVFNGDLPLNKVIEAGLLKLK